MEKIYGNLFFFSVVGALSVLLSIREFAMHRLRNGKALHDPFQDEHGTGGVRRRRLFDDSAAGLLHRRATLLAFTSGALLA